MFVCEHFCRNFDFETLRDFALGREINKPLYFSARTRVSALLTMEDIPYHTLDAQSLDVQPKKAEAMQISATLHKEAGREGDELHPLQYAGRAMAVFTSGGDSSGLSNSDVCVIRIYRFKGMNSAVRSVTRMGLYLGCKVYLIYEGYQASKTRALHLIVVAYFLGHDSWRREYS